VEVTRGGGFTYEQGSGGKIYKGTALCASRASNVIMTWLEGCSGRLEKERLC